MLGTLLDQPIDGMYRVEPGGTVPLGPAYGRADVKGLTIEEAEAAIGKQLRKVLQKPEVQVTARSNPRRWVGAPAHIPPYHIGPNDLLQIRVAGTPFGQPIYGDFTVEPGARFLLGRRMEEPRLTA